MPGLIPLTIAVFVAFIPLVFGGWRKSHDKGVEYSSVPAVAFHRVGYHLLPNYTNPFMDIGNFSQLVSDNRVPYDCGGLEAEYSKVNVFGHTPEDRDGFVATKLLTLMRDKSLSMVGDSLTRQYFVALLNELRPLVTRMRYQHNDEELPLNYALGDMTFTHFHQFHFEVAAYNASFLFCFNSLLRGDFSGNETEFDDVESLRCNNRAIDADYLVIGVAAWFKPFWLNSELKQTATYNEGMEVNLREYAGAIGRVRRELAESRPNLKVLWRGCPHAGDVDFLQWRFPNGSYDHFDSSAWNNLSQSAIWPEVLDSVTFQVALQYDDVFLDLFAVSLLYLDRFSGEIDSSLHPDSLHFCQASVSRGALFLLQQAIVFVEGKSRFYPLHLPQRRRVVAGQLSQPTRDLRYLKPTILPRHDHPSHPLRHAHFQDTIHPINRTGIHRIVPVFKLKLHSASDPAHLSPEYSRLVRRSTEKSSILLSRLQAIF